MLRALVTGSTGLLGGYLVAERERRRAAGEAIAINSVGGPSRGDAGIELSDRAATASLVARTTPTFVIHAAALSAIADCARMPSLAQRTNVEGTMSLADACRAHVVRLIHVSTDLVFDGEQAPYREDATPAPLSVYGRTKREAEREAVARAPNVVVVRLSLLYGPTCNERRGFFDQQLDALRSGAQLRLFDDEWRTPLSLRAAAEGLVAIALARDRVGTIHLGGPERLSRHEMGVALARHLGIDAPTIERASRTSSAGESRPRDVSLDSTAFGREFPSIAKRPFDAECERMLER